MYVARCNEFLHECRVNDGSATDDAPQRIDEFVDVCNT